MCLCLAVGRVVGGRARHRGGDLEVHRDPFLDQRVRNPDLCIAPSVGGEHLDSDRALVPPLRRLWL